MMEQEVENSRIKQGVARSDGTSKFEAFSGRLGFHQGYRQGFPSGMLVECPVAFVGGYRERMHNGLFQIVGYNHQRLRRSPGLSRCVAAEPQDRDNETWLPTGERHFDLRFR